MSAPNSRGRQSGVTLIELMIVVVIIGILASVAYPSYRAYVQRTHRTEAKSALLQLQADQERYYLEENTYASSVTDLQSFDAAKSENGIYDLSISGADANGYTATATPASGGGDNGVDMTDDTECASFSITADGRKSATSDKCW